jgi:hypothetical protein
MSASQPRDREWKQAIAAGQHRAWGMLTPDQRRQETARRMGPLTRRGPSAGWTYQRPFDDAGLSALRRAGQQRGQVLHDARMDRIARAHHMLFDQRLSVSEVARLLNLSPRTVKAYMGEPWQPDVAGMVG